MSLRLPALAALLLCAACHGTAGRHVAAVPESWPQRSAALAALRSWSLSGRVRARADGEILIGRVGWIQDDHHYILDIAPPVAGGAVHRLEGGPAGVTWQSPGKPARRAADAGALMQAQLGWQVPLHGARYWVVGLPAPAPAPPAAATRFDAAGRLRAIRQAGWEVRIHDYRQVETLELPARLDLVHQDGLELRLAIHRWQLEPR